MTAKVNGTVPPLTVVGFRYLTGFFLPKLLEQIHSSLFLFGEIGLEKAVDLSTAVCVLAFEEPQLNFDLDL